MRVLLVAPVMALSPLAQRLRRYGHTVVTVASALEGSALRARFDVGVVDLSFGVNAAIDLARRLLDRRHVARIIFFGDVSSADSRRRAEDVGAVVERSEGTTALAQIVSEMRPRQDSGLDVLHSDKGAHAKSS